jgi:P4 family phage/plasmid primase-like protien
VTDAVVSDGCLPVHDPGTAGLVNETAIPAPTRAPSGSDPETHECPSPTERGDVVAALAYLRAGVSVIPIRADGSKAPVGKWKQFQKRRATEADVARWINAGLGVAIVCGEISELEVLDFDAPEMFERWRELVEVDHPGALEQVAVIQSPRAEWGRHVYLRRTKPHGNRKLAERWARDDSGRLRLNERGKPWAETLIETRGEGGYVLAPGCPPQCHPTGGTYRHVSGITIAEVRTAPAMSDELYGSLVNVARSCTEIASDDPAENPGARRIATTKAGSRPGDEFNQRATWTEILQPHGWQLVHGDGVGYTTWRRPGKDRGVSATSGYCSNPQSGDLLRVFSSNAGLEVGAHSKFGVFAKLNHDGDFSRAARALRLDGYCDAPNRSSRAQSERLERASDASDGAPGIDQQKSGQLTLTDTGNAERLVAQFGSTLKHCHPWKQWLVWDGTRWAADDTGRLMDFSKRVVRKLYEIASRTNDQSIRDAIVDFAKKSEKVDRRKAMVDLARSEAGIPVVSSDLDRDPWLLNCLNGTFDLKSGEFRAHRPSDLITKLCPTKFDPGAPRTTWVSFLERVLPDDEVRAYFQRFLGYSLTGDVREQVMLLAIGEGSNGKSTALCAVQAVLSTFYAIQIAADMLTAKSQRGHPTEVADLFGVRLAIGIETSKQQVFDEAFVKQLTGGDRLRARRMREDYWEFDPTHKIVLATNEMPAMPHMGYALWRRLHRVAFEVRIPAKDRDKNLLAKLKAERAGILAWMIEGCCEWMQRGLDPPDQVLFPKPDSFTPITVEFIRNNVQARPGARLRAADVFGAFQRWCGSRQYEVVSQTEFGRAMGRCGFGRKRISGLTVYVDAAMLPAPTSGERGLEIVVEGGCVQRLGSSHDGVKASGVTNHLQPSPDPSGSGKNAVLGAVTTPSFEADSEWGEQ